MNINNLVY